jgi:hypothetical protein
MDSRARQAQEDRGTVRPERRSSCARWIFLRGGM